MPLVTLLICVLAWVQAPTAARSATLTGRVVDAVSGRPVPGVIVTPAGSAVPLTPSLPRALTNGTGVFVIRGLEAGTVFLTAEKSGYGVATYNQRRPGGSGQAIRVEADRAIEGIEIRIWRYASITGTVVDEAGEPAVGVRVRAFQRGFVAGRKRFTPSGSAVTDDRGVYRIGSLLPGDYAVGFTATQTAVPTEVMEVFFAAGGGGSAEQRTRTARELGRINSATVPAGSQHAFAVGDQTFTLPPGTLVPRVDAGGAIVVYPTLFFPSAGSLGQAGVFAIRAGEERSSVDLQLQPTRTSRVAGTVMAPDGPAANVPVRLLPAAAADEAGEPMEVAATLTNRDGRFTFVAVSPGQYQLSVLRPPPEPIDLDDSARVRATPGGEVTIGTAIRPATPPPPPPVPPDATLYAQMALAIGDTALTDLVVPLSAAPRIAGRVEFDGTTERPPGSVVSGIRINIDPADGSRLIDPSVAAQAGHPDEDGQFRTFGVPPGRYVLRINPPTGWTLKSASAGGSDISDVPFSLNAKDLTDVVITFTDRPGSLSGIVRDRQNPDSGAVVLLFPTDPAAWIGRGAYPRRMRTARADRDGSYMINGVPAGEYYMVAVHEESFADWQDPALLEALTRVARQVRVLDGDRRTQDLTAAVIR